MNLFLPCSPRGLKNFFLFNKMKHFKRHRESREMKKLRFSAIGNGFDQIVVIRTTLSGHKKSHRTMKQNGPGIIINNKPFGTFLLPFLTLLCRGKVDFILEFWGRRLTWICLNTAEKFDSRAMEIRITVTFIVLLWEWQVLLLTEKVKSRTTFKDNFAFEMNILLKF